MVGFLIRRLGVLVPTLMGVTLVAFGLIRLVPGDPVLLMIGERGASPEVYREMRSHLALDQPLPVQYFTFLKGALHGELGDSVVSKRPVWEEFKARFPATLELGLIALFLAVVIGIPLGIIAAVKRNSILDYAVMGGSLIGYSMPIFWWGLVLILFFSVTLGWTPVSGRIGTEYDIVGRSGFFLVDVWLSGEPWHDRVTAFWDAVRHLILPSIALGTVPLASIARMTRSSMLEVIGEDYVRTARAKGLAPLRVLLVHALRNALVPIVTTVGLMFGSIMTGAILTETIFSWPGIGKWLVRSVVARDYPVVQGGILLIATLIIFINMGVDLTYAWVNPRMREQR